MAEDKRLTEIDTRLAAIKAELQEIANLHEPDGDEAQRAKVLEDRGSVTDDLLDEHDALTKEAAPLREREARRGLVLATVQENVQRGAFTLANIGEAGGRNDHSVQVRTTSRKIDPFKGMDAIRSRALPDSEMVYRGRTAIEQAPDWMPDEHKATADNMIRRASRKQKPLMAQHVLITGSEEYFDNFYAYMSNPLDNAQRTAMSLTNVNGGFLVPFTLDPTIVLTNSGSANPYRQISNIKRTATNTWNGVASSGMNAQWLAEAGVVTDASPTFTNIQITPQKAAAWVFGSYEILEDSDFETELPGLLADAKDRLEEAAFATGTGSGQPKGIITAATTLVTVANTTSHLIAVGDVYGVQAALPARFRRNASWVASISAINAFRQLDTAGGSSYWTNLGQGQPERLLGGGVFESTTVAAYAAGSASKPAVYGDFNQYYVVDRIGMSVMYEPMIKDTSTGRPTGQGGWFAFWRVGADAAVPGAFRVLQT